MLVQRAVADSPRWTRAVGDQSNPPSGEKMGKQRSLDARDGDHSIASLDTGREQENRHIDAPYFSMAR